MKRGKVCCGFAGLRLWGLVWLVMGGQGFPGLGMEGLGEVVLRCGGEALATAVEESSNIVDTITRKNILCGLAVRVNLFSTKRC